MDYNLDNKYLQCMIVQNTAWLYKLGFNYKLKLLAYLHILIIFHYKIVVSSRIPREFVPTPSSLKHFIELMTQNLLTFNFSNISKID